MNKQIRWLIIITTVLLGANLAKASYANAGFFDWLSQSNDNNVIFSGNESNWSFDKIYNSIQNLGDQSDSSTNNAALSDIAVSETTIPAKNNSKQVSVKKYSVLATGYSSTVDQTDDTPFVTASGTYVRDGIVAANFLPMGTAIKIPELYGNRIFIVEDRMNSRYWYNIDIWFPNRTSAKVFGVKKVTIEVVS